MKYNKKIKNPKASARRKKEQKVLIQQRKILKKIHKDYRRTVFVKNKGI